MDYLDAGKPTSEIVNTIRSAFGLSITDLAGALGVERPTVYSWLKDQSTPTRARAGRLGTVLRLADVWVANTEGRFHPSLRAQTARGRTLLEALREDALPEAEIIANLESQARNGRAMATKDRLTAPLRDRSIPQRPDADFDAATNRPLGPEL
jgi:transcriptional regulator with XRE-family HTH domain